MLEGVLRQSLPNDHTHRAGWHPEHGKTLTDTPTAERLLQACPEVSLTILTTGAGEDIVPRLTPLSALRAGNPAQARLGHVSVPAT